MTGSPAACTVYVNGSFSGNCQTNQVLQNYFALPQWWFQMFYVLVAAVVVVTMLFLVTKWRQKAYGRFLEGFTGVIGVARSNSGVKLLGKITPYIDSGLALFDPGKGKGKGKKILRLMPDSIINLGPDFGGVSFCFVDLDKGVTVDPHVAEWAQGLLGELSDSRNFARFAFAIKLKLLEEDGQYKPRFPPITQEQVVVSGTDDPVTILSPKTVVLVRDGKEETKETTKLTDAERRWYDQASQRESEWVQNRAEKGPELMARLQAALSGSSHYVYKGIKIDLTAADKTAMLREIEQELAGLKGKVADAFFGGITVSLQHVAQALVGVGSSAYVEGIVEEIYKDVESKIKGKWKDYIPLAVIFALIVGTEVLFGFVIK